MKPWIAFFLVTVLAGLLTGCGQVPQPFQPDNKRFDLRQAALDSAVLIDMPSGLDTAMNQRLRSELQGALVGEGLTATVSTGQGVPGYRLETSIIRQEQLLGSEEIELVWVLSDRNGRVLAKDSSQIFLDEADFDQERLWRKRTALTEKVALQIGDVLRGKRPETQNFPGFPDARLIVQAAPTAPGDGATALQRALRKQLDRRALPQAGRGRAGDLQITPLVQLFPLDQSRDRIVIAWVVEVLGEGGAIQEELGRVTQENAIPRGQLDQAWGATADLIAETALPGLEDLLRQAGARRR